MATVLEYNGITFTEAYILNGNIIRSKSPITDELSYDTLDIQVIDRFTELLYDSQDSQLYDSQNEQLYCDDSLGSILPFTRGTPGSLYHDNQFIGKFYIDSINRIGKNTYELHFVSALGILDRRIYKGGIYNSIASKTVIADIFGSTLTSQDDDYEYYAGDIPFYIAKRLGNLPISGWLPYNESSRASLQQILFSLGGSVLKTSDGTTKIDFWQPTTAVHIPDERLYTDGQINYRSKATQVVVTEHEFRSTSIDKQVELFDSNSVTVNEKTIIFSNPIHNLSTTGNLTIGESGANYAIVSGSGKLLGYEYTHNTTTVTKDTGVQGDANIVTVSDAYLVSALNSYNVTERVSAYYGYANEVIYGFNVLGDIVTGDRVEFTDPFGETQVAYLSSEDITLSAILKAQAKFITDWQPNHVGNTFNHYTILSTGTTWNVPQELQGKPARVVIFGGFEGGKGGYNGADGEAKDYWNIVSDDEGRYIPSSAGGNGGNGGTGGTTVHMNIINIESLGNTYSYSLGTGGSGGSSNGGNGSLGGDSTFNGVSTAIASGGVSNTEGYANPITGQIYGGRAESGVKGGKGGNSGKNGYNSSTGKYIVGIATAGESVGDYNGGSAGGAHTVYERGAYYTGSNSGGGGACAIASGGSGRLIWYDTVGDGRYYFSQAGNGASASTPPPQADLGKNGRGGCGGGGGGGVASSNTQGSGWMTRTTEGRKGGSGQRGQQGSNGFILVLHD